MPYLTPESRLRAAASRAAYLNTLTVRDLEVLHAVLTRRHLTTADWRGEAHKIAINECGAVHQVIHCRRVRECCAALRVVPGSVLDDGPLALFAYDAPTATELTALTALVNAAPLTRETSGEDFGADLTRRDNLNELVCALRWAAISAATVGFAHTLDDVWRAVEQFAGLPPAAQEATVGLATSNWAGTLDELHTTVTTIAAH